MNIQSIENIEPFNRYYFDIKTYKNISLCLLLHASITNRIQSLQFLRTKLAILVKRQSILPNKKLCHADISSHHLKINHSFAENKEHYKCKQQIGDLSSKDHLLPSLRNVRIKLWSLDIIWLLKVLQFLGNPTTAPTLLWNIFAVFDRASFETTCFPVI